MVATIQATADRNTTQPVPRSTPAQVWDLMQLAYQLGITAHGERTHCAPYGVARWDALSFCEADDLTWALRRVLLHDLDGGGQLVPPSSRFYDPAQRPIEPAQLAGWRRRLAEPDGLPF